MDSHARLGGQEDYIFDPVYKSQPPLCAFRLRGQELVEEVVSHKRVRSEALGLEMVNDGQTLRLFNPQTGEFLRTPAEEAARRAAKLRELAIDAGLFQAPGDLLRLLAYGFSFPKHL